MFSRRIFMKNSALALFGAGTVPIWLSRAVYAKDGAGSRPKTLVVIFMRGAVDGLSVVVPHGEDAYYEARPSIAIPRPGGGDTSVADLDGHFGLHPSLRPMKPLWDAGQLAIVHACGSPDPTRSHFDAQDYMESGTPGLKATPDGWLNRALPGTPEVLTEVRAVSLTDDLPRSLRGRKNALAIHSLADFQIKDAAASQAFESMYANSGDAILNGTARETFDAMKLIASIQKRGYTPANNASYPKGQLGDRLKQIATLIKASVGLEVAFTDAGGWDTHVNQPGQLANRLGDLGSAMAAFAQDMGDRMEDVTVVTMSEFGRTVKENGDRGTDHGHANMMFVMGGRVRGGLIYGAWPGLEREQLYEGRDLAITTDFRTVLSEVVSAQLGNRNLASVFPGFQRPQPLGLTA
jgi:uncharacterized protein (DUF1501 family)